MARKSIRLADTVPGTVNIRRVKPREWRVSQCSFGPEHDNNQNVTWLRIENPGRAARIRIHLKWAEFSHMASRAVAYVKCGRSYRTVAGAITPTSSVFEFVAPSGPSHFGTFPWYTNADADRFLSRMCRRSPRCRVRSIGTSAEGRDIKCLTIGPKSPRKAPQNVVVLARMHANESSGSFAVEATARFLLSPKAPRTLLSRHVFHVFPIVNPDGVANGAKLTRLGDVEKYDMVRGGVTSSEPTIMALRRELFSLRPACLISHHSYLWKPAFIGFFEKQVGLAMADYLLPEGRPGRSETWLLRHTGPEPRFLRWQCYKRCNATVCFTELPWQGRLPHEVGELGLNVFRATLDAHAHRRRRP